MMIYAGVISFTCFHHPIVDAITINKDCGVYSVATVTGSAIGNWSCIHYYIQNLLLV